MDLLIKGFKNKETLSEFIDWYSNSGEQDFSNAQDYNDNPDVADGVDCDGRKTYPLKCINGTHIMYVKCFWGDTHVK